MVWFHMPSFFPRRNDRRVVPDTLFRVTLPGYAGAFAGLRIAGTSGMEGMVVVDLGRSEAIKKWNRENPENALAIGHVIVEVNGLTSPRDMLDVFNHTDVIQDVDILVNTSATGKQRAVFEHSRCKFERAAIVEEILEEVPCCGDEICAICHEDMGHAGHASTLAKLPCGHQFHKECVKKWLVRGKLRCPLCNSSVARPSETTFECPEVLGGWV